MPSNADKTEALWRERSELCRPLLVWSQGARELEASKQTIADWEATYPDRAMRWRELSQQLDAAQREQERIQAQEREQDRIRGTLLAVGIGARNLDVLATPLLETPAMTAVRDQSVTFLLLSGAPGTGKSVSAALALKLHVEHRRGNIAYIRGTECSRLSLFDEPSQKRLQVLETASLLVVDDLGVEQLHDTCRQLLEEIFDQRYQGQRRTVVTTNLDTLAFAKRYGERITDRLVHDGLVVACGDESFRRRKAANGDL